MSEKKGISQYLADHRLIYAERLPTDMIADVVVNTAAADLLSADQSHLATPDWLVDNGFFNVPFEVNSLQQDKYGSADVAVYGPWSWTRSIPIATGCYPYGTQVGTVIYAKGVSSSGNTYMTTLNSEPNDPWGFFGRQDAATDILVSNSLLVCGGRIGLPLGYLVLDDAALARWIKQRWDGNNSLKDHILKNLDKVRQNRDVPVVYTRIASITNRIDTLIGLSDQPRRRSLRLLGDVFMHEALLFPDAFFGKFIKEWQNNTFVSTLRVLKEGSFSQLGWDDIANLRDLYILFSLQNLRAMMSVLDKFPTDETPQNLGTILSNPKDICLAFTAQDFEEAVFSGGREKYEHLHHNADQYIYNMSGNIATIFSIFFREIISSLPVDIKQYYSSSAIESIIKEQARAEGLITYESKPRSSQK